VRDISHLSTFTPQLQATQPITTDDLERDAVFAQRVRLFRWVREKHLDVPEGEASQGFLGFAEQGKFLHNPADIRTSQDQSLQSAKGQANLYPQLLQSHLWLVERRQN
jgi:hypothetical protein